MMIRDSTTHRTATAGTLLAGLLLATAALGQVPTPRAPEALRNAPPEVDRTRPGGDPADPRNQRSGGGPTGNDIMSDSEGGGIARGVIPPPMGTDPGIQGQVPEPRPNTTPVIPPPVPPGTAR